MGGMVEVYDAVDDATALHISSRLKQEGLHPYQLRSRGNNLDGFVINALRVMVPPQEAERALDIMGAFRITESREIDVPDPEEKEPDSTTAPKGVGGWLLLLLVNLIVLAPLMIFTDAIKYWVSDRAAFRVFDSLQRVTDIVYAVSAALALLGLIAGISLWRVTNRAIWITRIFLKCVIIYSVAILIAGSVLLTDVVPTRLLESSFIGDFIKDSILGIWFGVFWLMYLRYSERVQNTYPT